MAGEWKGTHWSPPFPVVGPMSVAPQMPKRGRSNDSTVAQTAFKAAKMVAKAAAAKSLTERHSPQMDILSGECQESFSSIRRKQVPRSLTPVLAAVAQRTNITSDSGQLTVRDGATEFFQVLEMMSQSEVTALAGVLGASENAKGVYIGGNLEVLFTNHSSGTQFCKLYVLIPRIMTNDGPNTSFDDGVANLSADGDGYTNFGMRPGDSPLFRDRYRVSKLIKFCLAPGQSHMHHHKYDVDKLLDDLTEQEEQVTQFLPEWTICFVLQSHGIAATSSTGGTTTTTAGGQFNYCWNKRHRMKFFALDEPEDLFLTNGLPTKDSITERVYNTDTSAPENVNTGD